MAPKARASLRIDCKFCAHSASQSIDFVAVRRENLRGAAQIRFRKMRMIKSDDRNSQAIGPDETAFQPT